MTEASTSIISASGMQDISSGSAWEARTFADEREQVDRDDWLIDKRESAVKGGWRFDLQARVLIRGRSRDDSNYKTVTTPAELCN